MHLERAIIAVALASLFLAHPCLHAVDPEYLTWESTIPEKYKWALFREHRQAQATITQANKIWLKGEYFPVRGEPFYGDVPRTNFDSLNIYPDLVQTLFWEGKNAVERLIKSYSERDRGVEAYAKLKRGDDEIKYGYAEMLDLLLLAAAMEGNSDIARILLEFGADRNALFKLRNDRGSIFHLDLEKEEKLLEQSPGEDRMPLQPVENYIRVIQTLIDGQKRGDDLQSAAEILFHILRLRISEPDEEGALWLEPHKAAMLIEWFVRDFEGEAFLETPQDFQAHKLAMFLKQHDAAKLLFSSEAR